MIFGWPIEVLGALIILFVVIGIYIGVIYSSFKKYEDAEKVAGNVLMELEPSNRTRMIRRAELITVFLLMAYLYLKQYIQENVIRVDGWIIIPTVIAGYCLNNKPQKICEKGILIEYGLFPWENIKEIIPVDASSDKIKILLHKRIRGGKKIILYSEKEDIPSIVHMIERKINSYTE